MSALLCWACISQPLKAAESFIILQSTTSAQNSGLYDYLLPIFEQISGVEVRVVAVGSGQAIKNAGNCDGDVLLVHDRPAEDDFVASGLGLARADLMYNDYVIVGPRRDPAKIAGLKDVVEALKRIAAGQAVFISRGDNSGTNKAELALWTTAEIDTSNVSGSWYRETGSGMGASLNTAASMNAYVMTDRATWLSFGNKADLVVMVEGDRRLFNQYGVILVNPAHCKNTKSKMGQQFINWLLSSRGQGAIGTFRVNGIQVFFPNAQLR
ncbi:UNVERIFIED_CONTAM: hypothetical protein GTU68_045136 [Idotea baltica]|nr:hypothetical protein [Idotea baltica]